MVKVIRPGNIFFKDDIKIIDPEIGRSLNLPKPPIFSNDELQVFYNGGIYHLSENKDDAKYLKVYTRVFGLEELTTSKTEENKYFSDNSALIKKVKEDFIDKVVNGISVLDNSKEAIPPAISKELIEKIKEHYEEKIKKPDKQTYVGKNPKTRRGIDSVFETEMTGCERVLLLNERVYDLLTISEFVSQFKKSFNPEKPEIYKEFEKRSINETPEKISKFLLDNKNDIHKKAFPLIRNKIWHSNRSLKLFLDKTYWVPEYSGEKGKLVQVYQNLLEKKVKVDAVKEYLRC